MALHRGIYAVCLVKPISNLAALVEKGLRCLLAFSIAFDGCAATICTTLTQVAIFGHGFNLGFSRDGSHL
jgi:hypothetical protein